MLNIPCAPQPTLQVLAGDTMRFKVFANPTAAGEAFERGRAHLHNGAYELAAAELGRAIKRRRDHAAAWYLRAIAHRAMADFRGAAADFNEAARLAQGGAVGELKEAISWQGDDPTALYNRGLAFHNEQDLTRAINNYSEALKLRPDWAAARLARGITLKERDHNNPHGPGFDNDRSYARPSDCISAADDFHTILALDGDEATKRIAKSLFDELTAPGTPGHDIRRRWNAK